MKIQEILKSADFLNSVKVMWQSMLAIFLVMAVISIVVYLFTKISKKQ